MATTYCRAAQRGSFNPTYFHRPAGYHTQMRSLGGDTTTAYILGRLTEKKPRKQKPAPSAPRKFSWQMEGE